MFQQKNATHKSRVSEEILYHQVVINKREEVEVQ